MSISWVLFATSAILLLYPWIRLFLHTRRSDLRPVNITYHHNSDSRENTDQICWLLSNKMGCQSPSELIQKIREQEIQTVPGWTLIANESKFKAQTNERYFCTENTILTEDSEIRELHCLKKLEIKSNSKSSWWITAKQIFISDNVILSGKMSAEKITFEVSHKISNFEILHAKEIHFLNTENIYTESQNQSVNTIENNIVSDEMISIAASSRVKGCLLSSNKIIIGPNSVIGTIESPISVIAPNIEIQAPCTIHGYIRAWAEARVVST